MKILFLMLVFALQSALNATETTVYKAELLMSNTKLPYNCKSSLLFYKFKNFPIVDTILEAPTIDGKVEIALEKGYKYLVIKTGYYDSVNGLYYSGESLFWPFYPPAYYTRIINTQMDEIRDTIYYYGSKYTPTMMNKTGTITNEENKLVKCMISVPLHSNPPILAKSTLSIEFLSISNHHDKLFVMPYDSDYVPGYWRSASVTTEQFYSGSSLNNKNNLDASIKLKKVRRTNGKYSYTGRIGFAIVEKFPVGKPFAMMEDSNRIKGNNPIIYVYDIDSNVVEYTYGITKDQRFTIHGLAPGKYLIQPEHAIWQCDNKWIEIKDDGNYNISDTSRANQYLIMAGGDTDPNKENTDPYIEFCYVNFIGNEHLVPGDKVSAEFGIRSRGLSTAELDVSGGVSHTGEPASIKTKSYTSSYKKDDYTVYVYPLDVNVLATSQLRLGAVAYGEWVWDKITAVYDVSLKLSDDKKFIINPGKVLGIEENMSKYSETPATWPNPASSGQNLSISFEQLSPGNSSAEIYSFAGIIMARHDLGHLDSGMQTFKLSTEGYAAGVYICIIRSGKETIMAKFVVK